MNALTRRITPAFVAALLMCMSTSVLVAQSDSGHTFHPKYTDGEKWVVDYQSDFASRFQVEAQGKVVDKRRVELIDNRKYVKTFKKVKKNKPAVIEHFYVRANRKKQPENKQVTMEEQGAQVTFTWNSDTENYDITSTSHELSESTRQRLLARELYRYFLPDTPVTLGSDPWEPDVEHPVEMVVALKGNERNNVLIPNFQNADCELANVWSEDGNQLAEISIQLSTSEAEAASDDRVSTRLEGSLVYNLDRQKPVEFSLSSRPAGISFKQKIEDTTLNVKNMGISISVKYHTSPTNDELNMKAEPSNSSASPSSGEEESGDETSSSSENGE